LGEGVSTGGGTKGVAKNNPRKVTPDTRLRAGGKDGTTIITPVVLKGGRKCLIPIAFWERREKEYR